MTDDPNPTGPPDPTAEIALSLRNVGRRFAALHAVRDVTLDVRVGERRAILGPNGAGKTTLFNTICGDYPPTSGTITLHGEDITHLSAHQRTRKGIGRTYQTSLLFNGLTVEENIFLAVRGAKSGRFSFLRPKPGDEDMQAVRSLCDQVRLSHVIADRVEFLSHGQRRQLEVAMALASRPRILMLDEPAAGLSSGDRPELTRLIRSLPRDLTLILIEHDMDVALPNSDMVTVMKDGAVVVENRPDRIADDPEVRAIYLGAH